MKFLQEQEVELDSMQRRINHLVEVQQIRKVILDKTHLVLKWEARIEEKGKHGKFDHIWQGPYKIFALSGRNAYFLSDLDGKYVGFGPINGRDLKHYIS